jgi:hypothetical protein
MRRRTRDPATRHSTACVDTIEGSIAVAVVGLYKLNPLDP